MRRTILFSQGEAGGSGRKRSPKDVLEEKPRQALKVLKMLHIEDERQMQTLVMRMAKGVADTSGVKQVWSAEEAMKVLWKTQDFNLILLDLRMETGMGGIGFVRKLKQAGKQELLDKIIITSGTLKDIGPNSGARDVYEAVGGRVLEKPFDMDVLVAMLKMAADGWEMKYWVPLDKNEGKGN